MSARVVSLQVGEPAALEWRGRSLESSIAARRHAPGPVELGIEGFSGDRVGDPSVHGGPDKAACCYPSEHLPGWSEWIGTELPYGAFGENLTLEGLTETDAHIGDVFKLGGATVQVCQPRGPCFKLAARWGRREFPAVIAKSGRSGFYFRVLEPGAVTSGDELKLLERGGAATVAEVMRVTYADRHDDAALAAVIAEPALAHAWRNALVKVAQRGL